MNTGFLFALLAGLVWSLANVLHKVLASKLIKSPIVMLLVFSSVALVFGIVLFVFEPSIITGFDLFTAFAAGMLYLIAAYIYLVVMRTEEASRVVPLFAIGSILMILLSALFLGEVFSLLKYTGIFLIIAGSVIISIHGSFFSFLKSKLLGLMFVAGICLALNSLIIKILLRSYSFTNIFSHISIFEGIIGIVIALVLLSSLKNTVERISWKHILLNATTEVVSIGGELLYTIALSLWYLSMVETIASLQFVFIFLWGILLSKYWPRFLSEEITRRVVMQKIISIVLIIFGVYLIA